MASRGQLVMEDMLKEVQCLVDDLKHRNELADRCVARANVVTDKLAVMKEYNQDVTAINECIAPEGRANLVAGLQHESRQIQMLQEEHRQMEQTIIEMQRDAEFLMNKHRQLVEDFRRSDKMLDLVDKIQASPPQIEDGRILKLAKLLSECIKYGSSETNKYKEIISQLSKENQTLRKLLDLPVLSNELPM